MESIATVKTTNSKIKTGSYIADFIIYTLIGIIALATLFPFIYILSASISDPMEVVAGNVWFLPKGFSLKSYGRIFTTVAIVRAFGNSVFFYNYNYFLKCAEFNAGGICFS